MPHRTIELLTTPAHLARAALLAATLTLAACANDQTDVAREMVDQAAADGMTLDEGCVDGIAAELSDEDVRSLEEGSDATTSPEGEIILARMVIECGTTEEIADIFLADLGDTVDRVCIAEWLKEADLEAGMTEAMTAAATECLAGG